MSLYPKVQKASTDQELEDAITEYVLQFNCRDYHMLALLYKEAEEQALLIHLASVGFGPIKLRAQELLYSRTREETQLRAG